MNLIEALEFAFGVSSSKDFHRHKCPNPDCKFVWKHDGNSKATSKTKDAYEKAHRCVKCGTEQYWKFNG